VPEIFWVIFAIGLPIVSSYILCRQFALSSHSQTKALTAFLIFVLLYLFPVHLAATLELFNIFSSVSLPNIVFIQFLILLGLIGICYRPRTVNSVPLKNSTSYHTFTANPRYIQAAAIILFFTMGIFALNLLTGFPKGYDALTYHYLIATRWLQEESLRLPPNLAWQYCLPGNAHIGMMIMMSSGFQSLILVMNILASCISGFATYGIAFKLSRHRSAALLATIVFLSIPIVQYQAFTGYVDLYGAAFILAGITIFLYRLEPPQSIAKVRWYAISVFLSGCAWGIAIGTKQTYYVYAFVCLTGAIITIFIEHKKSYQMALLLSLLMAAGVFIPCYYWFLRAFEATGNLFYPYSIELSKGMDLSSFRPKRMMPQGYADSKYVRSILEWFVYPWVEYKRGGSAYSPGSGFGAAFASTVTVGVMFSALSTVKNWYKKEKRLHLTLLLALFLMSLLWWFVLDRVPRFTIPALALACGLTAPVFARLINAKSQIFKALILSSVSVTCSLLLSVPVYQLYSRIQSGVWQRSSEYHYPSLIDHLPNGTVIWNRGHELSNFPLAGRYLSNKVISRYGGYHMKWGGPHTTKDFIQNEKIDYITTNGQIICNDCNNYGTLIYKDKAIKTPKIYQNWQIWKIDKNP
jgi:hypothetical protein